MSETPTTNPDNEMIAQLENFIFERMTETRLPGLSLALIREGEVMHVQGFGQRDMNNGLPATPDTLYSSGSITKSFTALAILQLVEDGVINLDDPVSNFLPFYIKPAEETITLHHLLTHTLGLPALAYSEALMRHAHNTGGTYLPIADPEDILTFMKDAEDWTEGKPGERWHYSNEAYAMLGLIIQQVSGIPYTEYIRDRILAPLSMERSFFRKSDFKSDEDVAIPYLLTDKGTAKPGKYLYRLIRSEGGLISNVMDLSRYVRYLMKFLRPEAPILKEETLEQALEPYVALPYQPATAPSSGDVTPHSYYGYGFEMQQDFYGEKYIYHGGNVMVATAFMGFVPERGAGVVLLANGKGYPLSNIAQYALALVMGEDPNSLPFARIEHGLDALVGRYESYRSTMQARVIRHQDFLKLVIEDKAQPQEIVLVPESLGSSSRFYTLTRGLRLPVRFRRAERGGIELLYERYKFRRVGR